MQKWNKWSPYKSLHPNFQKNIIHSLNNTGYTVKSDKNFFFFAFQNSANFFFSLLEDGLQKNLRSQHIVFYAYKL